MTKEFEAHFGPCNQPFWKWYVASAALSFYGTVPYIGSIPIVKKPAIWALKVVLDRDVVNVEVDHD